MACGLQPDPPRQRDRLGVPVGNWNLLLLPQISCPLPGLLQQALNFQPPDGAATGLCFHDTQRLRGRP
ncbi:MAG: hypothetical protein A2V70_20965 [Planctomycetes bacterium RBG_13_63_9]|nr:MAG: hypothetical protein A2V70_20965 [Planctomycetes bacterium RBG_13_63_9]